MVLPKAMKANKGLAKKTLSAAPVEPMKRVNINIDVTKNPSVSSIRAVKEKALMKSRRVLGKNTASKRGGSKESGASDSTVQLANWWSLFKNTAPSRRRFLTITQSDPLEFTIDEGLKKQLSSVDFSSLSDQFIRQLLIEAVEGLKTSKYRDIGISSVYNLGSTVLNSEVVNSTSPIDKFIIDNAALLKSCKDAKQFLIDTKIKSGESLSDLIDSGRDSEAVNIINSIYYGFQG